MMELIWCFVMALLGEQRGREAQGLARNNLPAQSLYLPGSLGVVEPAPSSLALPSHQWRIATVPLGGG